MLSLDAELVLEGVFLGIDVLCCMFLKCSYDHYLKYIKALKRAEKVEADELESHSNSYVCIRGKVEPVNKSHLLKSTIGQNPCVIREFIKKEVIEIRNTSVESTRPLYKTVSRIVEHIRQEIPWTLVPPLGKPGQNVKVDNGFQADRLDMPVSRSRSTPIILSTSEWLASVIIGVELKETQEFEGLVTDGSSMTVLGELIVNNDGSMLLQAPAQSDYLPFIVSKMSYGELLTFYDKGLKVCKWSLLCAGGIGLSLALLMLLRWQKLRDERQIREIQDISMSVDESSNHFPK